MDEILTLLTRRVGERGLCLVCDAVACTGSWMVVGGVSKRVTGCTLSFCFTFFFL